MTTPEYPPEHMTYYVPRCATTYLYARVRPDLCAPHRVQGRYGHGLEDRGCSGSLVCLRTWQPREFAEACECCETRRVFCPTVPVALELELLQ